MKDENIESEIRNKIQMRSKLGVNGYDFLTMYLQARQVEETARVANALEKINQSLRIMNAEEY